MNLTRRRMMAGMGAAAGMAAAGPVWSSVSLGQMQIDTLSDGTLMLPGDFIFGPMPKDELRPIIDKYGVSPDSLTPECNLTLVRDGERVILFDVGSGPDFMPSAGKLQEAFDAIGLSTDEVTHVVFTHGHPDHLWGLLDDFGDPLFYDAEYMMGAGELDYWMADETVNTIGEERQSMAVGAKRRLEIIADQITTFDDGAEILPGILAHGSFGHTPGHMSFELRSGSESVMVLGDAIGNHHVAFEKPGWVSGSDQDGEMAAATRLRLFDKITADKMRVIGFHLPGGGLGHADAQGDGFVFVPEDA
ncbi:MBL fold metallo-hydrolase [Primorskyibacter aestuariivivens]|uniref:MBL fold metallo-hydrolase n=1 Tax=Primorskyibacter aestuariivivens TaxID=1888912 RepID=UPI0023016ADA|nr:MBL fold metallo-hydrolase [Primorskyibacter aestuariivivens]MDA7430241.1 MBL fold metallo-hydrolase [Primorskyibacter aestuariivivens]